MAALLPVRPGEMRLQQIVEQEHSHVEDPFIHLEVGRVQPVTKPHVRVMAPETDQYPWGTLKEVGKILGSHASRLPVDLILSEKRLRSCRCELDHPLVVHQERIA